MNVLFDDDYHLFSYLMARKPGFVYQQSVKFSTEVVHFFYFLFFNMHLKYTKKRWVMEYLTE